MKILYHALVESRLSYGILGWGGVASSYLSHLDILQKKFLKICFNKSRTYSSTLLYSESKILDLRQIYFLRVAIDQFKNKSSLKNIDHNYSTRAKKENMVRTEYSSKTIGQRGYTYLSTRIFNNIPRKIKDSTSVISFRKHTKQYLHETDREIIHNLIDTNKVPYSAYH